MAFAADRETWNLDATGGVLATAIAKPAENPLTPDEISGFQQQLQQLRDWLLLSIAQLESRMGAGARRLASSLDGHDVEWEHNINQRAIADKRLLLSEVMNAFERIRINTYGRCVADNSSIPRSLLEEVPWARYCSSCASRHHA